MKSCPPYDGEKAVTRASPSGAGRDGRHSGGTTTIAQRRKTMIEWQRLEVGIRARIHPTRKHGALPDRYFVLRYSVDGIKKQEALGWASRGWTLAKARDELAKLRAAARTGEGPVTLK